MADLNLPDVPKKGGKTELNSGKTESRVDKFSGQHTTSLIIGLLFIVVFIGFIIIVCVKSTVDPIIYTGFFSILSGLIGFFTGTKSKRD
jgi:hypothetical protein